MAAFVRLKRKRDEEPNERLLVACKKDRRDDEMVKREVFKFAGTVSSTDSGELKRAIDSYKSVEGPSKTPSKRKRDEKNGYSLVGQESIELCASPAESSSASATVYDIIRTSSLKDLALVEAQRLKRAADEEEFLRSGGLAACAGDSFRNSTSYTRDDYVYDLFVPSITSTIAAGPDTLQSVLSVEDYDEDYNAFYEYRNDLVGGQPLVDDEDDSNDEDNWRNDYPHEEDERDYSGEQSEGDDYGLGGFNLASYRLDDVALASGEDLSPNGDYNTEASGAIGPFGFGSLPVDMVDKDYDRYYNKGTEGLGACVGECNTSEEECDSESDCNDDLC